MSIDYKNLEKQTISAYSDKIFFNSCEITVPALKKKLDELCKKAKKDGLINPVISISAELPDDEGYGREGVVFSMYGQRQETEEEWFKRIQNMKNANEQELQRAKDTVNAESLYLERIQKCNDALEKSTLRCQDCGVPSMSWVCSPGEKTSRRICSKCSNIRSDKYLKSLKEK